MKRYTHSPCCIHPTSSPGARNLTWGNQRWHGDSGDRWSVPIPQDPCLHMPWNPPYWILHDFFIRTVIEVTGISSVISFTAAQFSSLNLEGRLLSTVQSTHLIFCDQNFNLFLSILFLQFSSHIFNINYFTNWEI